MRVLLIDTDSAPGFPNLALMKISAWRKAQGDSVQLIKGIPTAPPIEHYDKVFASCVFFQNRDRVYSYLESLPHSCQWAAGGTGINPKLGLPEYIEHMKPDYELYPTSFDLGFTSRGCIRHCAFCVVYEKEGPIRDNAPITEFHDPRHDKLILLDNNFLASPKWRENLAFIQENRFKVNFNQGLDIRLLTEETAKLLVNTQAYDWQFKTRKLAFAFDSPVYRDVVERGIGFLHSAGFSDSALRDHIMFYVLVGFDTSIQEDLERVALLRDKSVGIYIMRYNRAEGPSRILLHLARWVNRKFYQHMDFCDYNYSDSKASYRAVFGKLPDPSFSGYRCPVDMSAWMNRPQETDQAQTGLDDFDKGDSDP